jgi:hypothetical protein
MNVYAIKNNRVVKKIGVYEKIEDNPSDMFDLSTFSEGSLCLFDVYERNPSLILELEEFKDEKQTVENNVFDYLLKKMNDEEIDKKVALTKNSYKGILLVLSTKKKEGKENENSRIITNLLNIIKKTIGNKKYYGEETQENIKKYATNLNKKILSLIVSEPFLNLRFIFTKNDEMFDDSEFREWSIKTDVKEYVIVSVDTFDVIETYPSDSLDERYMSILDSETMTKGTSLNETEPSKEETLKEKRTKTKTKLPTKTRARGTSLNGPFEESKAISLNEPLSTINESVAPSKDADVDLNSEEQSPAPETKEVDLNAEEPETETMQKVDSKEVDLNSEESEPAPKSKSIKSSSALLLINLY